MCSVLEPSLTALHNKTNNVLVKLFVSALLVGISFRLFFSLSGDFLPVSGLSITTGRAVAPVADGGSGEYRKDNTVVFDAPVPAAAPDIEEASRQENCDLFAGEWIPKPSGPAYTNASCRFIEPPQNCMKNGRPDTGYLYWRWKPHGCDVPPFDAVKFLTAMQNKSWALVGDSILRNHFQSLICLLSKAEEPVEVAHEDNYKSRKWHFPSHNFSLSLIWTPFLIKADIFENDDGESKSEPQLHLDTLDTKWTHQYSSFDYVVISGGQWFLKTAIYWENRTVIGCHYCPGKNITDLALENAYGRVLQLVFRFITSSVHKPVVFYRTWTPDHFENGEWFSGGTCNRTVPYRRGEFDGRDVDHFMRKVELEEFKKAVASDGPYNVGRLKLLDTYYLSLLRPDGHAGPYRAFHPFYNGKNVTVQKDCLHWCLPGPIDTWNDLIMEMLLK